MGTPETALTSGSSGGAPTTDGAALTPPAPASGGDTGVGEAIGQAAQAALDQSTATTTDPLDAVLAGIPETDDDLQAFQGQQSAHQQMVAQRQQLRALNTAVRDLRPLQVFKEFGDPTAVKSRLKITELMFTPVLDSTGKPARDPETQTTYVTTGPLWEYLDEHEPGMSEQALVDLLAFRPRGENGQREAPLVNSVFAHYKLNPARLSEYQNIDALIARTSGAITPEELAEIPEQYHAAYRTIPPSIRNAWKSYDAADQTRELESYKDKLDAATREQVRTRDDEQRRQAEIARQNSLVYTEQVKHLDTVRRERTASMIQSLAQQVTYSTDAVTNEVMLGVLAASLSQLLDPAWRFLVVERVLTPLGLKLDHTFDTALDQFDSNAADSVALRMAGQDVRAAQARDAANHAADQLMARIAIFALKIAARQGATVSEKAATQGAALATAATGRPGMPAVTSQSPQNGQLPPGMKPGTREAVEYLARNSGYLRVTP